MAEVKVAGKFFEIGEALSLSGQHLNHYFQNRRWPAECVALKDRSLHDLKTWLPYVQDEALLLRLPLQESAVVLEQFPHLPTAVHWLEAADALVLQDGEWWPRLTLVESLRGLIVARFRDLDISLNSYVIGANRLGRIAAAVMASLGYRHISLVDEDPGRLARELNLLRRYLFGVQIDAVPAHTLTVQERPGSLMLNALALQDDSTVLGDLSYFNFMKTGGVVVDASEVSLHNRLLEEAERADLKILSGLEVAARADVDMLMKFFPQQYITYDDYFESFCEFLASLKNSSSV